MSEQIIRLVQGDCIEKLKVLDADSVGAIITDPPYLIGFMNSKWDKSSDPTAFHKAWLTEAFRVLQPGGLIKVFSGTRTKHRLEAAVEDAGFELLAEEAWGYGCLSEDTEILTQEGWVPYHRAKIGMSVVGFDPVTGHFTWQAVEETFEYPYDRDAFRLRGVGTDQIVSEQHRCIVEREGRWEHVVSGDLADTEVVPCLQIGIHAQKGDPGDVWALLCESSPGLQEEALVGTEGPDGGLHGLRQDEVVSRCVAPKRNQAASVFPRMQRSASGAGLGEARAQRGCCGDARGACICDPQDDRPEQPCVERRGDEIQEEGQLRQERPDQVFPMPHQPAVDGPQGRVHHGTSADCGGGCGSSTDSAGSGSPCEPQPHRQSVGEPDAVCIKSGSQAVRAPRNACPNLVRVCVHVEQVHYKGTVWCVKVATGAFVARRNGMAFITGNSGFPKSLNISKAVDKTLGVVREVVGSKLGLPGYRAGAQVPSTVLEGGVSGALNNGDAKLVITASTDPVGRLLEGWGTAFKPGWEPFVVGRKTTEVTG